ncbi:MAG: hypothetical protein KKA05_08335 [Alphaproteobacteria bacterium]|nr:hypothetical protein [Alphaproteobacteria bacterium]MBU0858388.1 hypothetical protein [Alphaproteobacteria bacterium]
MTDNDNQNPTGKIVNLTAHVGRQNHDVKGPAQSVTGEVTEIHDLSAVAAVAFRVKHGRGETLFWMSTTLQEQDRDYRKPLMHEMVRVWFNNRAQPLNVFGEMAAGIVEIQNISNDSEQEAFKWFRDNPDGLKPR